MSEGYGFKVNDWVLAGAVAFVAYGIYKVAIKPLSDLETAIGNIPKEISQMGQSAWDTITQDWNKLFPAQTKPDSSQDTVNTTPIVNNPPLSQALNLPSNPYQSALQDTTLPQSSLTNVTVAPGQTTNPNTTTTLVGTTSSVSQADLNKASTELNALQSSGFITVSTGFANLANSLGISISPTTSTTVASTSSSSKTSTPVTTKSSSVLSTSATASQTAGTWVSQDTSKSYYGQTVTKNAQGKIVVVSTKK